MPSTTLLTVDLDALAHNYRQLVADACGADVAPVVKADGYGLGVGPVARRLWLEGARRFFVARLEEGEALRTALAHREARIIGLDGLTFGAAARMLAASSAGSSRRARISAFSQAFTGEQKPAGPARSSAKKRSSSSRSRMRRCGACAL